MTHTPKLLPLADEHADVLHQRAQEIPDITAPEMQNLIADMFYTMTHEKGCGLAAPQVGIGLQLSVIEAEGNRFVIGNPEIISTSKERVFFEEGCLSLPGREYGLIRHEKITVRYTDEHGSQKKIKLKGFLAIVFQHEIDHLYGIMINDRFEDQEKARTALKFD